MEAFMMMLLTCSAIMSFVALLYMAATPLLLKKYSAKGLYYSWLIVLIGFIIPFRPQWSNSLLRLYVPRGLSEPVMQDTVAYAGATQTIVLLPFDLGMGYAAPLYILDISWWQLGFWLWVVGVVVFFAIQAIKHIHFTKTIKRWAKPPQSPLAADMLERLKTEMGIKGHIDILICESITSPMLYGVLKPRILLHTEGVEQGELSFILQHELIHHKRKDLIYKLLVVAGVGIHWFNPIAYMMAKAINQKCELSCDAKLVEDICQDKRQQYAEAIIGVVRHQSKLKTTLSTTFYGGAKTMKNRIKLIMTTKKKKTTLASGALALGLVSMLLVGTLTTFAAEREAGDEGETTNRIVEKIGRRVNGILELEPRWQAKLDNGDVRFYELDQVTPFDFSLSLAERLDRSGPLELFRVDVDGNLTSWEGGLDSVLIEGLRGLTLEELAERGFTDIRWEPSSRPRNLYIFDAGERLTLTPITGPEGNTLMYVPDSFFHMSYEEFNQLANKLLTTAFVVQTQEAVDILKQYWLNAQ